MKTQISKPARTKASYSEAYKEQALELEVGVLFGDRGEWGGELVFKDKADIRTTNTVSSACFGNHRHG